MPRPSLTTRIARARFAFHNYPYWSMAEAAAGMRHLSRFPPDCHRNSIWQHQKRKKGNHEAPSSQKTSHREALKKSIDPNTHSEFWNKWNEFEIQHNNEDMFREMLHIKCTVAASSNKSRFILPEYLMQRNQRPNQYSAPFERYSYATDWYNIELLYESADEKADVQIAEKSVPALAFGDLGKRAAENRKESSSAQQNEQLGALGRIKR